MEWIDRLNRAVEYLEEHLEGPDLREAAKIACCSPYHFQRMFSLLAGAPLSEYIRRRRMSRAAADLQDGEKIVDVALKYGYSSPTAFNRAFQAVHGLPPSAARAPGAALMDGEPKGLLGVCDGLDSSRYYIAAASSAPAEGGLEEYTVPAFTWAVFPGEGESAAAVQALERRVVAEWLPTSGYEYAEGPDVEVYLNPECTRFEVWIPVVKAKG